MPEEFGRSSGSLEEADSLLRGEMIPVVSVITPTKNRLALLCQAIDSVQAQTFSDWEHIIVDDGSDDGTREEVERRAAADPRIRYIPRSGRMPGANVCRNLGIRQSQAEFIVFLDSDDLLEQHCLAQRVGAMQQNTDLDFAVFPGHVFTEKVGDYPGNLFTCGAGGAKPHIHGGDLDYFLYLEHPWITPGPIYRRLALAGFGLFSEQLPSWQDVDLHIRALVAGAKYLKFDVPDHHMRWKNDPLRTSAKQFRSPEHLESGLVFVHGLKTLLADAEMLTWWRRRALGGLVFLIAEGWTVNGRLMECFRAWGTAYRLGFVGVFVYLGGMLVLTLRRLRVFRPPYDVRLAERFRHAVGFRTGALF